jgi:hypothetical protein
MNQEHTTLIDPFDPSRLRLSQDYAATVGVKKQLITVPVRKPNRQDFIRVRSGAEWCLETAVLELKDDQETYLVDPSLWSEMPGEIIPKALFVAINRQGVVFLWPVKLPREDGRQDGWGRSAIQAAQMATNAWVRIAANMSLGAYEVYQATGDLPEPTWPEVDFKRLLEIAFKDRFIQSLDHPVIRKLKGEF